MVGNYHREVGAADPIIQRLAEEDKVPWYKKPNLRIMYFWLFITCMGVEITSGFDSQMINALQIVPSWKEYFNDPQGTDKSLLTSSYSLGAVLSLPFVPWVSNKLGRRWSVLSGSVVLLVGAILQGAAQNTAMYVTARIVLGFGIPLAIVNASALLGELGHPKERSRLTSFFNVSYFVGQILAAGICFRTNTITNDWAWRIPSYLQICPSLFQIGFVLMLPESPRWLIAHDRHDEAAAILYKYHAEGDLNSEFVRAELAEIETTIKLELEAAKDSWLDLLRDKGMRKRTLVTAMLGLFTQWSGNTLISYYLGDILGYVGMTDSMDKQKFNLGNSCWNLICALTVAMLVKKFRRRVMYMTCTIALLCVYIGWTITYRYAIAGVVFDEEGNVVRQSNAPAANATLFFILAYSPCYNIGYNALTYTYLIELWPYALRSRGITFFQLFGRLATFFNTFVNPIALEDIQWKYLITYVVWLAYEVCFVYFFFPETHGRTLEELAFLFEDKDLTERAVIAAEKVIHGGDDHHTEDKTVHGTTTETEEAPVQRVDRV
jgi:sugar porter (SP) family MFS transporter